MGGGKRLFMPRIIIDEQENNRLPREPRQQGTRENDPHFPSFPMQM